VSSFSYTGVKIISDVRETPARNARDHREEDAAAFMAMRLIRSDSDLV
jgi:hypothetical protein